MSSGRLRLRSTTFTMNTAAVSVLENRVFIAPRSARPTKLEPYHFSSLRVAAGACVRMTRLSASTGVFSPATCARLGSPTRKIVFGGILPFLATLPI